MANTVILDPITRIEGHLAVEITTNSTTNVASGVECQGKMFRGFELIMANRNPRDTVLLAQRI
jgi:hydrogenase large subunit